MGGYTSRPNFATEAAPLPDTSTIYINIYTKWYIICISDALFTLIAKLCVLVCISEHECGVAKKTLSLCKLSPLDWSGGSQRGVWGGMSLTEVPQMPQIELGLTPSLWSLWRKQRQWQIHRIDKDKDNYKDENKSCALGIISVVVNKRVLGETKKHYYVSKVSKKTDPFFGQ